MNTLVKRELELLLEALEALEPRVRELTDREADTFCSLWNKAADALEEIAIGEERAWLIERDIK
jgi:hypothetical protein